MYRHSVFFLALILASSVGAQSSTVYKHVDKDGKVTYSEKPPAKDEPKADAKSEGKADSKKLDMDNKRNVIKSYAPKSTGDGPAESRPADKRAERNETLRAQLDDALRELDDAKAALETGKDPLDDEWQTVGVAQGRPSRVPSEAYHRRIKSLEQAVKDAEERVKRAESAFRRGAS